MAGLQKRKSALLNFLVVAAIAAPLGAYAADWTVDASLTEEFQFDDNIDLDVDNSDSVWGLSTRPQVTVGASTPRVDLSATGQLEYAFFQGQSGLDSFDQQLTTNGSYRGQRHEFKADAGVNRATTRTTEDLDTGLDFTNARVLASRGSGSWSYALTDRNSLGVRGGVRHTTYDTSLLEDFINYTGGVFFGRQMSEKDSLELSTTYTRFEALDGLDNVSNAVAGTVGWTHVFSPKAQLSANIGVNHARTDEDVQRNGTIVSEERDRTGAQGGASFTWLTERSTMSASFQSGFSPSGSGQLDDRNTLQLDASYQATPVISLDLGLIYLNTGAVTGSSNTRNFISVEPAARWQFLPDWEARFAYKFRTQKQDDDSDWARSNGVRAAVTYKLPVKRLGGS